MFLCLNPYLHVSINAFIKIKIKLQRLRKACRDYKKTSFHKNTILYVYIKQG